MSCSSNRRFLLSLLIALLSMLILCWCPPASSAPYQPTRKTSDHAAWMTKRFLYEANGKRLSEVLQDFAASQGIPAVIADGVDGVVHGNFDSTARDFLDAISRSYGIIWYHDGTTLYIYPSRSMQSKLFRIKGFTREQVQDLLSSLGLGDSRYPLRFNERQSTLMAYGPPRHLELISQALESMDANVNEHNATVVRVFTLHYASPGDRMVGNQLVPGMVTLLRGIYGGAASPKETIAQAMPGGVTNLVSKMQAMRNVYGQPRMVPEMDGKRDGAPPSPDKASPAAEGRGLQSPVSDEDQPWFEADEATNSVIVRGKLRNMAEYHYLIQRLDVRPVLVEIEAVIIDVDEASVDALGIDWSARGSHGSLSVSPTGTTQADSGINAVGSGGFTISTLWANAGRELLAKVDLLQSKGQARIVAKPKVIGVMNRPAVMEEKRTAVVRVAGNLDAQLFNIEAGTRLQVTPQLSEEDGTSRIKLSLYIEDGNFEGVQVDNVPLVKRTEIRTEAHVLEGESVLVGGITIEAQSTLTSGVPGVSKLPIVGGLFRTTNKQVARTERLFLITPKLIHDAGQLPPPAQNQSDPVPITLPEVNH